MKKLLYTLALLVSFSSFGQEDIKQGLVINYFKSGEVQKKSKWVDGKVQGEYICLLYTSPSPRDRTRSRMPSSA